MLQISMQFLLQFVKAFYSLRRHHAATVFAGATATVYATAAYTIYYSLRRHHAAATVYDAAAGTVYAAAQSLLSPQLGISLRHHSLCRYMHSLRRHHTTATVYAVAAATVYPEEGTKTAAAEEISNAAAASGSDIGGPYGQGLPP
jgi:uncharacterized protein (DUF2236 family)